MNIENLRNEIKNQVVFPHSKNSAVILEIFFKFWKKKEDKISHIFIT